MSLYKYRVRDRQGKALEGQIEGPSTQAVSQTLYKQGYIPISISSAGDVLKFSSGLNPFRGRVHLEERNAFTRQMWTLQKAGLPIVSSLASLRDQTRNKHFRKVLADIIQGVEAGTPLSEAFARYPEVFDTLYVNMIRAGEFSGKLEEVLLNLVEMGEFEADTRQKIKSATRYPLITIFALIIAFLVVITFVIPKFGVLYNQFGAKLPLPTRILLGINHLVRHDWLLLIMGLVGIVFLFRYYIRTPSGRFQWDFFKIRVPVFGKLIFYITMSRFTKTLSELLASGLPIVQSLQLVSDTLGNEVLRKAVLSIQRSVNEGKGMTEPMKKSGFFAPLVVQMMAVGEQSGKTDELLKHVSDYYTEQSNYMTKNLATLIEPMLIFMIGGMVLLLAMGVFMPMWNMTNVVNR